jgi:predicted CXXCH cytochrome family protein
MTLYHAQHLAVIPIGFCLLSWACPAAALDYIGGEACKSCHEDQYVSWKGSHHDLAMQEASEQTVLGDFNNASVTHFGITTRFFKKDSKFLVHTEGPDGHLHDYPIKYSFGAYPLQQYLIPFPGGRLQVLDIAWDSRSKEQGGQRWMHLHPDEKIPVDDVLHWTGPNLNWNYMCADCHSTHLKKDYDGAADAYHSTWSEMNVSCEACHGPGSAHQKWAHDKARGMENKIANKGLTADLTEREGISWQSGPGSNKPLRSEPNQKRSEIAVCARCHSRRSQLSDDFTPGDAFLNTYHPSLLVDGLYYPDGQMQDEVFVWGSFQQSKMYHAGVTCSDCHDPHKADLKLPGEQVCYQCHDKASYASRKHHFHDPDKAGASCVECHMPATVFMQVDRRHDHSFRIPRPDLSVSIETHNACNQCHVDKDAAWATQQLVQWYAKQPKGYQRFARTLQAARTGKTAALSLITQLILDMQQPNIARATALSHVPGARSQQLMLLLQQNLNATDPLLRLGTLQALEAGPSRFRILAFPLVWDDLKTIRITAARLMAGYPRDQFKPGQGEVLDKVIQEYVQTQEFNAERPESQVNLGALYKDLGDFIKAEQAYRKAIKLQPQFVPAYVNFAQMLSEQGRETEASGLLQAGIRRVVDSADLYHALGLSMIRQKKSAEAVLLLGQAAELDTGNARYVYVYAVALQSAGKQKKALDVLSKANERHPADTDILYALVTFNREAGRKVQALIHARKLQVLLPTNEQISNLIESLQK